jgi:hypothetical protein
MEKMGIAEASGKGRAWTLQLAHELVGPVSWESPRPWRVQDQDGVRRTRARTRGQGNNLDADSCLHCVALALLITCMDLAQLLAASHAERQCHTYTTRVGLPTASEDHALFF